MLFYWIKTLHLIAITLWIASMLSAGVLITVAAEAAPPQRARLGAMARRLYLTLGLPSMGLTLVAGVSLISVNGMAFFRSAGWLHTKIMFVIALVAVDHVLMRRVLKVVRQKDDDTSAGEAPTRLFMVAALLLVTTMVFAVVRPSFS